MASNRLSHHAQEDEESFPVLAGPDTIQLVIAIFFDLNHVKMSVLFRNHVMFYLPQ